MCLCFVDLPLWVSYLKICSLPCFSPVNINYVPCEFLGTEFEIAPANRLWPGVYLNISPLNEFRILPWIHSGVLIGWMMLVLVPPTWRVQKSHRRKRSRSVEDDEEGHLICQSGDVLSARCIEYFSTLIYFSDNIIYMYI